PSAARLWRSRLGDPSRHGRDAHPKAAQGSYFPGFLELRRMAEKALTVAVVVAVGVNADGRQEVLGLDIGPSEAETFWTAFPAQACPAWPERREACRLRRPWRIS